MLKTDVIAAEDNAVFVQVTSDGSWTLSLDFAGQEEWAQLSRTSGTGSSNSIVLACETNTSGNPRSVTVIADFRDNSSSTVLVQLGAEESLSPDEFFRISRGTIVNIRSIVSVRKYFKGRLKVSVKVGEGTLDVVVSAARRDAFLNWMGGAEQTN